MRVPWLSTTLTYDCGPACLAMVLAYHGRDTSVDEIRERLGTGRDGTNGYDIVRVGREMGLDARGVRVEDPEALPRVPLPAIAHYKRGHFVVLEECRPGRSVRVVDPLRGRLDLPLDSFREEFSGVAVLLRPGPGFLRSRSRTLRRFFGAVVRENRGALARLAALSLLLQGFAFALPVVVAFLVDRVIPRRSMPELALVVGGVPILMAAYALSGWIRGAGMAAVSGRVSRTWLDGLFRHLLRLPLPFFHGRPVEELLLRVQGSDAVLDEILDQIVAAILDTALALTALVALWTVYPEMSALVVAAAALQGLLTWLALRQTFDDFIRDILANARLYAFVGDALGGIADLKMMGLDRVAPAWRRVLDERVEAGVRRKRRSALWDGLLGAAQAAAPILILAGGAAMAIENRMSVGAVVGFYSLGAVCLAPVGRLAGGAYRLRSTAEYVRRAHEILSARPEAAAAPGTHAPGALEGRIALHGVSFRYSAAGDEVLQGIDLQIRAGETVVIVGRTGSGKSTLAKVIATLYEPTAGRAEIDGVPVDRYDRAALRSRIGAVFQENVLLEGSILDNVAVGREMPTARIYRALAAACLLDEVKQMPMGFATPVGAAGLHLSGGQRQRLCLARAIAARPSILVLDEATSSVDRLTERRIYRRLGRLRCTKVIVTHRLYIARGADRVIVLEGGRLVETGTHEELIERGGLYARMWGRRPDGPAPSSDAG